MVSAYSIGTSKRSTDVLKSTTPGPGTYQNTEKKPKQIQPSWKIGSEERQGWKGSTSPGPGRYDPKIQYQSSKERGPTYYFGSKPEKSQQTEGNSPGPASYEPNINFKTLPLYSMRPKTQYEEHIIKKKAADPSPGFYETNYSTIINIPSVKIGKDERSSFKIRSLSPGPGKYIKIDYKPDMAQYSFGTQNRQGQLQIVPSTFKMNEIGPGKYDLKSMLKQNIGPSLTPRRKDISHPSNQITPGPGTYESNVQKIKRQDPQYRIGKSQRNTFDTKQANIVGPGQYSPKFQTVKLQQPQYQIGSSQRIDFAGFKKTPGPGTYDIPQRAIEGPQHSLVPRRENSYLQQNLALNPAPNKYDVKIQLTKEKHFSMKIGTSQRNQMISRSLSPGPGQYKEKSQIVEGPEFSFGKEKRSHLLMNDLPGPGQYDLKPFFADVPKYLISEGSLKKISTK